MLPDIAISAETGQMGDALNPLCWVATRELQSSWMAKMLDILQLFTELQVEAEPGPTLPTLLGSY